MRDWSKISPSIWRNNNFHSLEDDRYRYFYLYIFTNQHQNCAGAYRLPLGYAAEDLNWQKVTVEDGLQVLARAGLIVWSQATDELYLRGWFVENPAVSANHQKGVKKILNKILDDHIRSIAVDEFDTMISSLVAAKSRSSNPSIGGQHLVDKLSSKRTAIPMRTNGV